MLCHDFSHFLPPKKIAYYTQSTVCQGGFSNKFLSIVVHGRMQDLPREANYFLFGGGAFDAWRCYAFARGVRDMPSRKKILNGAIWCVLEHIFINILLSKSLKISFLYKNNYKL